MVSFPSLKMIIMHRDSWCLVSAIKKKSISFSAFYVDMVSLKVRQMPYCQIFFIELSSDFVPFILFSFVSLLSLPRSFSQPFARFCSKYYGTFRFIILKV